MSRVFLSHSWRDKALARRVARRLRHRGVEVWIDESEMQVGDQLSDRLIKAIQESKWLLVLVTPDAMKSKWIACELSVARKTTPAPAIIPLITESGLLWDLIDDHLGVDIFDPLTIEDRFDQLSRIILDGPIALPDVGMLDHDLAEIGKEAPELQGLISALMTERVTIAQTAAVCLTDDLRHPAETALISLYERSSFQGRYVISLVAASFYLRLGIGYPVLRRHISDVPIDADEISAMFFHLGDKVTRVQDFEGVFRLFELAKIPPDLAFNSFVQQNFDRFNERQKARTVEFAVTPPRGPKSFAIDLGFELLSRMPTNSALKTLWFFWINDYCFGGLLGGASEGDIGTFYACMNEAKSKGLVQFDHIIDHFRSRFRALLRSRDFAKINEAIQLLVVAIQRNYTDKAGLSKEVMNAVYSAEWDQSCKGDELSTSIEKLAAAAVGEGDFFSLFDSYSNAYQRTRAYKPG